MTDAETEAADAEGFKALGPLLSVHCFPAAATRDDWAVFRRSVLLSVDPSRSVAPHVRSRLLRQLYKKAPILFLTMILFLLSLSLTRFLPCRPTSVARGDSPSPR